MQSAAKRPNNHCAFLNYLYITFTGLESHLSRDETIEDTFMGCFRLLDCYELLESSPAELLQPQEPHLLVMFSKYIAVRAILCSYGVEIPADRFYVDFFAKFGIDQIIRFIQHSETCYDAKITYGMTHGDQMNFLEKFEPLLDHCPTQQVLYKTYKNSLMIRRHFSNLVK